MLRKLNTYLTIPIIILAAVHLILMAGLLTGIVGFNPNFKYLSSTLFILLTIHVIIGIIFMVGKLRHKGNRYAAKNSAHLTQMISGILMYLLLFLHIITYGYTTADGTFILRDPTLFFYITECLLAATISLHCLVSIPRLAISLGRIKTKQDIKTTKIISAVVSAAILIIAITAFSLYYLPAILGGAI